MDLFVDITRMRSTICFSRVEKYGRSSYVTMPATLAVIGVRICSGSILSVSPDSHIISCRSNNFTRRFFFHALSAPYCCLCPPCIYKPVQIDPYAQYLFVDLIIKLYSIVSVFVRSVRCRRAHAIRVIKNHVDY